jgi:L-lactate dehydrogenase (cytochrome)
VTLDRVVNIADLRRLAERRLPRVVFDYIDGGAEAEITLRENCRAFEQVTLRPRSAVAAAGCDLRTTVLGTTLELPFVLAPLGSSRMFFPRAEAAAARVAGEAGTAYVLSTLSGTRLEDVKAATTGPAWYQVYLVGGREGVSAIVVTVDTAVPGLRERDVRNRVNSLLSGRLRSMLPALPGLVSHPRWLAGFLSDGGLMSFPNVELPGKGPMPYADVGVALSQSMVSWTDLRWIRDAWPGLIVIKGIHTAEDARRAVEAGADAIVVSNHGGRQLDGVAPTLRVLPEVVAAVAGRIEIMLDGGIRRGSDVVKALAMGARAVLVGRAYAYGLGAAGGPGVHRAIEILRSDIIRTLKLLGCSSVAALDRSYVGVPPEWEPTGDARFAPESA